MKKLIILLFFIVSTCAYAQTDSVKTRKWAFGANVIYNRFSRLNEFDYSIYVRKGRHYFSIGQTLHNRNMFNSNKLNPIPGVEYRFYIRPGEEQIRYFIPVRAYTTCNKNNGTSIDGSIGASNGLYYNYTQKLGLVYGSTGFGVDLQLARRLHLTGFIGFGYDFRWQQYEFNYPANPAFNHKDNSKYPFNRSQIYRVMNISFGIDIFKKK